MKVSLAYGKMGLEVNIPEGYHTDIIEPKWVEGLRDQEGTVSGALKSPIQSKPLKNLVGTDTKVGIIFSDITRATPYHIILPALLSELKHVRQENITFFCATGTHRPATKEELNTILGSDINGSYRIIQNDTNDKSLFVHAGNTASGNEIWINRELADCDLKILTGFIEPHFFMGFSGGGKAVMPGMGLLHTIRFNHSIAMLENENARWGITTGNPLWEDVQEAAELLSNLFLLNITLNKNKEITGVFAGDLRSAHRKGCAFAKETAMVAVDAPYDLVITSNSGYPLDLNVYQSVKGMSAAAQIVKQGGEILIAAECWDGIPENTDYDHILKSANSINELYDYIKKNEENLQDTWQIFFQVIIQQKANVSLYTDKLDDETVHKAHLSPVNNPDELIEEILRKKGPQARVCVLPEGPQTIPYMKQQIIN
ncbi:nickel-dependent lactate racemase [Bacteroidota bacterium]